MNNQNKYAQLLNLYYLQLNKQYTEVEDGIIKHRPDLSKDRFYVVATWLWIFQKQLSFNNNSSLIDKVEFNSIVSYIINEWNKSHERIWEDGNPDIYLSNISMAYAALKETKDTLNLPHLQQNMTMMKDYVFDNLLSKGTVLDGVNTRNVSADQLLSVLPYGLFSPEDLIIVEAVEKIENQLKTNDDIVFNLDSSDNYVSVNFTLSLYYLEKSNLEKALYYSSIARKKQRIDMNKLESALLNICDFFIESKKINLKRQIIHNPLGNENVYLKQPTERIPHFPTTTEGIRLACKIVSEIDIKNVYLYIENENNTWSKTETLTRETNNEDIIYESVIEPLKNHNNYQYHFIAELVNGDKIFSTTFKFSTLRNQSIKKFKVLKQTKDSLLLTNENNDFGLLFSFTSNNGLEIKLVNQFKKNNSCINNCEHNYAYLNHQEYSLKVNLKNPKLDISMNGKNIMSTHHSFAPIEWKSNIKEQITQFVIHWYSPLEEQFYGFGERYNSLEQRGEVIDCYVYNQYRDQGTRTYIPIPFFMTNSNYGCFIDTELYTQFDIAHSLKDKLSIKIDQISNQVETSLYLFFGDMKNQLKSYTELTGKAVMVPTWALGPWMSSNNWDRQSIVENEVLNTNKYDIPATVLVIEQWTDETTYYMFNDAQYELKEPDYIHKYKDINFPKWGRWPDPEGMVSYLHDNNIKLLLWQIPIQKYLNNQTHPLKDQDEQFMIEKGYIVKNSDGSPYRIPENWFTNSLLMDFSNEEAKKWWFGKRQYLIDIGVDGFKTDGGEFVFGKDLIFSNNKTGAEMRNRYPNDYVSSYYEFAQQNNGITFSRAGYTGAQNFPAHWAGDERSTFSAFRRTLIAGINSGLAGIIFWGWDLAGFNGDIPTSELFMRSTAMATFCPIMQYHAESKAEFNQDRTPWNIAERTDEKEVLTVYRFFANVRMNLIPYIHNEAMKATETGLPLMRALMIDFPEDERVYRIYDQYLFGDSLLIAPVILEGANSRSVYFPEEVWFNLWTDEIIIGPTLQNEQASLNEIPVYVKSNHALLFNVNYNLILGSSVGNDITKYNTPLCKIYFQSDFKQVLKDHLGNTIILEAIEQDEKIIIQVQSDIDNIEYQLVGSNKRLEIIHK